MVNDYSDEGKLRIVPYDTRFRPIAPPETGIFDEPTAKICINVEWIGHIDGALERLLWRDAWDGDQEIQLAAIGEIRKMLAAMQERVACDCEDCMNCEELTDCLAPLIMSQNMQAYQIAIREAERIQQEYQEQWDGTPESINPNAPSDNFDGDGSPARDEALCAAASAFVRYFATNKERQLDVVYGGLFTALALAFVLVPGFGWAAALALGIALGGATLVTGTTYSTAKAALEDESALDAVACCLSDGLEGLAINTTNFEAGLSSCGFTGGSNNAIVRDFVALALAGNFMTFIDFLGTAKAAIDNGEPVFCPCEDTTFTATNVGIIGRCGEGVLETRYFEDAGSFDMTAFEDPLYPGNWAIVLRLPVGNWQVTMNGFTGTIVPPADLNQDAYAYINTSGVLQHVPWNTPADPDMFGTQDTNQAAFEPWCDVEVFNAVIFNCAAFSANFTVTAI